MVPTMSLLRAATWTKHVAGVWVETRCPRNSREPDAKLVEPLLDFLCKTLSATVMLMLAAACRNLVFSLLVKGVLVLLLDCFVSWVGLFDLMTLLHDALPPWSRRVSLFWFKLRRCFSWHKKLRCHFWMVGTAPMEAGLVWKSVFIVPPGGAYLLLELAVSNCFLVVAKLLMQCLLPRETDLTHSNSLESHGKGKGSEKGFKKLLFCTRKRWRLGPFDPGAQDS